MSDSKSTIIRTLLLLALFPPLFAVSRYASARFRALRTLLTFTTILALILAITLPSIWDRLAKWLSLASGLDLIVYILVLGLISSASYVFGRFERINRQVTSLIRELAILREEVNAVSNKTKKQQ